MSTEGIAVVPEHFPQLMRLLPMTQIEQRHNEFERLGIGPIYQVERDLEVLARYVGQPDIERAYRALLRNEGQFVDALYEIRVAALLAPFAHGVVPSPSGRARGPDLKCVVGGHEMFFEVTTHLDRWPPPDGNVYGRATVEKSFDPASRPSKANFRNVPAAKDLRDRISQKVSQLPSGGLNVVVLGAPNTWSRDVEASLFGDEYLLVSPSESSARRTPNGLFSVDDEVGGTSRLGALVWLKLRPSFADVQLQSRLFVNVRAARPIPADVVQRLIEVFDRSAFLRQEVERMKPILVEQYGATRIILFGSLAADIVGHEDRVHQWSDIDLAVVKQTDARIFDRIGEVLRLVEPRASLNVLVYTPQEFDDACRAESSFVRTEIVERGRQIFP